MGLGSSYEQEHGAEDFVGKHGADSPIQLYCKQLEKLANGPFFMLTVAS